MNKILKVFENHKEISVVILILFILSMIIVPIPHALMDVLIGVNIGLTIIVLMVVIYMDTPLKLTSFPSILLILAVFRIGITISTSRLILLEANAGQIVETFGNFVVGGNLVVGVIIFIIITLVNFIVITKGSERVAEVAARFSLDAMPGKQMSIDSDLRAGNIDMPTAQRKRNDLGLESKLYGAMDGAMKFVKGDSIASIIDIVINIVGGLIVGIVQLNMSMSDALTTYTLLTVGDGLVQQIPALLISLTAGMMITKVSDDNSDKQENMGKNILNQIFTSPKALFSASALFLLMAVIPGMPSLVFLILFSLIVGLAILLLKRSKRGDQASANKLVEDEMTIDGDTASSDGTTNPDFVSWKLQPIVLHLAQNLKDSEYSATIKKSLIEVRQDILMNLGVEIPQIVIRYNAQLVANSYQLLVFEIPVTEAKIYPNNILLLNDDVDILSSLAIDDKVKNTTDLGFANNGSWVNMKFKDQCDEFGISYLTINQYISTHLSKVMKSHVSEFLGMQEVKNLLDKIDEYQDLIKELLRMLPLNKITEVLQRLIAEEVSIRNFKAILDAMLEWAQREKEVVLITEYVRQALGRYIAHKFSKGTYVIPSLLLDGEIEDAVRDAIRFNGNGSYLSLDPYMSNQIIDKVRLEYAKNTHIKIPISIITQMDIRRYVRSIIEKDLPYINVLSFQEVENHVQFNSLGVIEL